VTIINLFLRFVKFTGLKLQNFLRMRTSYCEMILALKESKIWNASVTFWNRKPVEIQRLWEQRSDKYLSLETLKQHHANVLNHLIVPCVVMYGDCILETPTDRLLSVSSLVAF
jgi:hypothetical protein